MTVKKLTLGPSAERGLYVQVFHGHRPETYEEWCTVTAAPLEARDSFLQYCDDVWPDISAAKRQELWEAYAADGFVEECGDGTTKTVDVVFVCASPKNDTLVFKQKHASINTGTGHMCTRNNE